MMYRLGNRHPATEEDGHFIAPSAAIIGDVTLKRGASVWFGAVLRGDNDRIEVGEMSNIQDGAILHTDPGIPLIVGDRVTVGHRAMLHGCRIGDNTLIGIGSTILNHATIGSNCIVGAHALVTEGKEFPDGSLIFGSPSTLVRSLRADEIESLKTAADVYVKNSRRYLEQLSAID